LLGETEDLTKRTSKRTSPKNKETDVMPKTQTMKSGSTTQSPSPQEEN